MKKLLLCLMVGVMSLTSCELSDPDGLGDPMKWSTVPSGLKNGELKVEAEGGSSLFACKNYKSFLISSVKEEGKFKENTSYKEFDGGWYLVLDDDEMTKGDDYWGWRSVSRDDAIAMMQRAIDDSLKG